MKSIEQVILLSLITLTGCRGKGLAEGDQSQLEGYPAKATANVRADFTMDAPAEAQDIAGYITGANRKISQTDASALAKDIWAVAYCFRIDNRVLTSQIRQESLFSATAKSPTGAVGLLQMTGPGIQEVEDQLGSRGTKYAAKFANDYFNEVNKKCLNKPFGKAFADNILLWTRAKTLSAKKAIILAEPRIGLVFGAIQLKTLLSKAKSEDASRSKQELYERALFLYNGDSKPHDSSQSEQEYYRDVIMRRSNDIK